MKFNFNYKELFRTIVNLDDTPHKLALSFAVGVFISLSPFFGIHTILSIALSVVFGLNKVSTIVGSWVNIPWIAPFVYYVEFKIGSFLLDSNVVFNIKPFTFEHYIKSGYNAFFSIFLGSIIMGVIVSIIFYFVIKYSIERFRRRDDVST